MQQKPTALGSGYDSGGSTIGMASAAEQIFESFEASQWERVQDAITRHESESLFIDFKRKSNAGDGEFGKDDRRNLGEALSGFANSEGGVIVWGMGTERLNGHDVASAVQPLADIDGVLRELKRLTPELVSPPVQGIRHLPLRDPDNPQTGVLITLIPQSDLTPHMARGPSQQRYYRRTEAGFRPMEHYEVADLFGRRAYPVLESAPTWRVRFARAGGGSARVRLAVEFYLVNRGRALANYPCITLGEPKGYPVEDYTASSVANSFFHWCRHPRAGGGVIVEPVTSSCTRMTNCVPQ